MHKRRIKINVENTKKYVKGKSSEEEDIKIPKCIRKIHIETVKEETKESSSEEEDIGIRKCRIRSRVGDMNEEVKGWTSSLKNNNLFHK